MALSCSLLLTTLINKMEDTTNQINLVVHHRNQFPIADTRSFIRSINLNLMIMDKLATIPEFKACAPIIKIDPALSKHFITSSRDYKTATQEFKANTDLLIKEIKFF